MVDATLGQEPADGQQRDAIHVAIAPAIANEKLTPGQDVGFVSEGRVGKVDRPIGIVDPFLKRLLFPEQKCFVVLYPNTVTGMRHHWAHPAFDSSEIHLGDVNEVNHVAHLRNAADEFGLSYEEFMEDVKCFVESGDYRTEGGRFEGLYLPDDFWEHYEAVTGNSVPENRRGNVYSCSC